MVGRVQRVLIQDDHKPFRVDLVAANHDVINRRLGDIVLCATVSMEFSVFALHGIAVVRTGLRHVGRHFHRGTETVGFQEVHRLRDQPAVVVAADHDWRVVVFFLQRRQQIIRLLRVDRADVVVFRAALPPEMRGGGNDLPASRLLLQQHPCDAFGTVQTRMEQMQAVVKHRPIGLLEHDGNMARELPQRRHDRLILLRALREQP